MTSDELELLFDDTPVIPYIHPILAFPVLTHPIKFAMSLFGGTLTLGSTLDLMRQYEVSVEKLIYDISVHVKSLSLGMAEIQALFGE